MAFEIRWRDTREIIVAPPSPKEHPRSTLRTLLPPPLGAAQPMYANLSAVLRAADPEALVFFEPTPFPDTYPASLGPLGGVYPVGFTEVQRLVGSIDRQDLSISAAARSDEVVQFVGYISSGSQDRASPPPRGRRREGGAPQAL